MLFRSAPGRRGCCRCRRLLLPLPAAPGRRLGGAGGQRAFGGRRASGFLAPLRAAAAAAAAGGCCCCCRCRRLLPPLPAAPGRGLGGARGQRAFGGRRASGFLAPLPAAAAAAAAGGCCCRCRRLLLPLPAAAARRLGGAGGQHAFGGRRASGFLAPRQAAAAAAAAGGCCCCCRWLRCGCRRLLLPLPAAGRGPFGVFWSTAWWGPRRAAAVLRWEWTCAVVSVIARRRGGAGGGTAEYKYAAAGGARLSRFFPASTIPSSTSADRHSWPVPAGSCCSPHRPPPFSRCPPVPSHWPLVPPSSSPWRLRRRPPCLPCRQRPSTTRGLSPPRWLPTLRPARRCAPRAFPLRRPRDT